MFFNYNKRLTSNAQDLRKNMTAEEKHLWYDFLKHLPMTVNRQKNIGNYIVDFFISSKGIVIEIDGVQHGIDENKAADAERDRDMKKLGFKVLRFKNSDIHKNFDTVCNRILEEMGMKAEDVHSRK